MILHAYSPCRHIFHLSVFHWHLLHIIISVSHTFFAYIHVAIAYITYTYAFFMRLLHVFCMHVLHAYNYATYFACILLY